ncbi:MAG: cysteine--tRNA ligase [Desulfobacterales bacterium]|nr:cysteine--tRNA ligase [Desulfobacterales bacterium]
MTYSILDLIGNTPLVEIKNLNPNPRVKILAKIEYFNPGGSIKDRAALEMIEAGEKSGELTQDKIVIEATSGNTGIGLALVCSVKGYKLLLAMAETASIERQKILKARGADILLTPGHLGTDGAIEEVYRLVRENPQTYFMTDQYNNEANWQAHYKGTGEEIWKQTGGKVTMVIATIGTSGTLMGISKKLKEYNPNIKVIGVEPYRGHKIQGLKNLKESYCPEIFDKNKLDKKVNVDDEEAFETTRRLAKEEGIFVGMSSGAAMVAARKAVEGMHEGVIVVIFPDSGERYLSTPLFDVREKVDLKFFNTLSRMKEPFIPLLPNKVSMYSCGPTAHRRMHPGQYRPFVFTDLLRRYLEYRGYNVKHIMNITDLDDKTIFGSEKEGIPLSEFTESYIKAFKQDLSILGIKPAAKYPRSSKHIEDMIVLAKKLVEKGYAYEKLRSLYFDISRFSDYGKLSGININKIKLGATVDLDEYEKDNPRDFTLFKRSKLSELKKGIYIKTDWGNVRPSWHIQCAAISMKYLGETFDIHTSSRELVFPHHENEIAIAGALTRKPLAKYWMHCDRVMFNGKKMSEKDSKLTIDDLIQMGYSGKEIRFWLLSGHYRKPIIFSRDRLDYAKKSLQRVNTCLESLSKVKKGRAYPELDQLLYDIRNGFTSAIDDDLNIAAALSSLFKIVKQINVLISAQKINSGDADKILEAFRNVDSVLKIFDFGNGSFDPEIQSLINEREKAREAGNWDLADKIRSCLQSKGITLRDSKV